MKRKIIRNWKVIKDNLDFNLAFNLYKSHKIDGVDYPIIGLRLAPSQFIQSGVDIINDIKLSPNEAISNKWEIVIPDNDAEEKTNKLRQMLKNKNFTGLRHDKIDNMSIDEMFNTILYIMDNLDKDNKYRIAKHIIENELYKKI